VGGPFAGEKNYYKLELDSARYFRGFFSGNVLELYAKTGVAQTLSGTSEVPFYDRYFLGGMYSLRGYKYRDVGPKQLTTDGSELEPVGGNTYWFGSAEYSVPIIERLRFALFYDVGNVYTPSYYWNMGNYNDDWGIGLRLNLPMGPMRLDYGIPITHDKTTSASGKFQFGVGFTRPF
jgi:outer membrane protein insertion porin family